MGRIFSSYRLEQGVRTLLRAGALALLMILFPLHLDRVPPSPASAHASIFHQELEIFNEVLELVAEKYVYPPDYKKIFYSAIRHMVESLPEKSITIQDHPDGQTLEHASSKLNYQLTFSRQDNMRALSRVYRFLKKEFDGTPSPEELEANAIRGVLNSLDTYSMYMEKEEFESSMRDTEGQYGGLGIIITMEDNKLTIVKVMKNSPVKGAGLQKGDIITQVDGEDVKGLQIQELADKLRGPPDTQVRVQVLRPKTGVTKSHTFTRKIISIETVQYTALGDQTGYIKISSFSKHTNEQLEEALSQAKKDEVHGLVLDLRNNPGGLLSQSVMVASHFLKEGELIVYTRGRHRRDSQEFEALFEESEHEIPVVILINHRSASASEIVAGSLRDSGKAILIGENSYGKGSVQTIYKMSDGSGLRLTTSKYFTPSGTDITEHGIVPEVAIEKDITLGKQNSNAPHSRATSKDSSSAGLVIKESELNKYLKGKNIPEDPEIDPLVQFAKLVVKDSVFATRSHALARAKELAEDIHY